MTYYGYWVKIRWTALFYSWLLESFYFFFILFLFNNLCPNSKMAFPQSYTFTFLHFFFVSNFLSFPFLFLFSFFLRTSFLGLDWQTEVFDGGHLVHVSRPLNSWQRQVFASHCGKEWHTELNSLLYKSVSCFYEFSSTPSPEFNKSWAVKVNLSRKYITWFCFVYIRFFFFTRRL